MTKDRIIGLDILRTIAILLVVYQHACIYLAPVIHAHEFQVDGVSVFFVLSGFLIGRILLDLFNQEESKLLPFFIFRWTKTLPSYFFMLGLILLYYVLTKQDFSDFDVSYLFFSQNFITPHPEFFKEAWSLSVEEWFYLLFPLLLLITTFLKDYKKLIYFTLFLLIFVASFLLRTYYYEEGIYVSLKEELRKVVLFRFDAIIVGFFASLIYYYYSNFWKKSSRIALFLGIFCLILLEYKLEIYPPLYFTFEAIVVLLFLPVLSNIKEMKQLKVQSLLVYISKTSYSIYLINLSFMHLIFMPFFIKYAGFLIPNIWFKVIYYLAFTFLWAYLLNRFIEVPFLNRRSKIVKLLTPFS